MLHETLSPNGRRLPVIELVEHRPPVEKVAPKDFLRRDQLGRTVVACPMGCVPPSHLRLTHAERASLIDPPPPTPPGTMRPSGPFGFYLENVAVSPGFVD